MSALSNLFQDIADAIRAKTGGTDKMAPAAFAQAIAGIETGGGGAASEWKYATGEFTPTETGGYTVVHNLGVMPDFVMVWATKSVTTTYGVVFANGFSQAVFDAAGEGFASACSVYAGSTGSSLTWKTEYSMSADNTAYTDVGCPYAPTKVTFRVGGGSLGKMVSGMQYEWVAIGGIFGGSEPGKYSLAHTISDASGTAMSINNAGTLLVTGGPSPAGGRPAVSNLSGESPVWVDTPTTNTSGGSFRYNVDDSKLKGLGWPATGAGYYLLEYNDAYTETKTTLDSGATGSYGYDVSPINNGYAVAWYASSSHYGRIHTGSKSVSFTVTYAKRVRKIAYSADGAYIAVSCYGGDVQIYNASTGALYKTISTGYASAEAACFTLQNKKLVVALSVAPWVAVYDFASGTKLDGFDFTDFVTAKPQILVIPCTNELVIGLNSTVRIFDISGDAPVEITGLPTFGGTTVSSIVANKNGTRLAISSYNDKHVEVWKRE